LVADFLGKGAALDQPRHLEVFIETHLTSSLL
jgi:hypothetical protein